MTIDQSLLLLGACALVIFALGYIAGLRHERAKARRSTQMLRQASARLDRAHKIQLRTGLKGLK